MIEGKLEGLRLRFLLVAVAICLFAGLAALLLVEPGALVRPAALMSILYWFALVLLPAILVVAWVFDRHVLLRLDRLGRAADQIASGQHDQALEEGRADEIGRLARSFNAMSRRVAEDMQRFEGRLEARNEELQRAKELLEESSRKLMESIHYARLIQASILARRQDFYALVPGHSVLWMPRDIVGGDFYALYHDDTGGFMLAVADCTGHGVPGAVMTMAAKAVLDRAVAVCGLEDPAAILSELHRDLRALLQTRYAKDGDNGLDMALVYVPADRVRLVFAGARLPLWVVHPDGTAVVHKGDRQSIGYNRSRGDLHFANHEVPRRPGERYLLLTDGILDQHGGEDGFALGQARLRAALVEGRSLPTSQIAPALGTMLKKYQGALPQRDDITLLAFGFE